MNRRLPFARLLALLCVLALLGAQVFGSMRGYVCNCTGAMEWTALDHCVGPHGQDCHSDAAAGRCASEEDNSSRKDHDQLRDDVQVRLLPAIQAPSHVPVLVAILADVLAEPCGADAATRVTVADEDLGPPPSLTVARTIVLLV